MRLAPAFHVLIRPSGSSWKITAVRPAYLAEQLRVARFVEVAQSVGAKERERVDLRKVIPHLLQANRRLLMTGAPEQIDHLAIETHPQPAASVDLLFDDATDERAELVPVE